MTEAQSENGQFSSATLGAVVAGRYRLTNLIGEGGMGQVFEAEHLLLGRPFALKVLRLEKWSDELVQRFQREARALARIDSPRVAQVTDYGVEERLGPYYVMELVRGETLEHRIARGMSVDEALHIAAESAEALAEVHQAGIVHRDVKPSNLGLPATGPVAVKLLDFGLAASIDDSFMQRLTKSQQVLGSLPYMAPEQFHGARPQPQMDIYAIGVVLFEALAGRLPFKAPSTAALIHQILAAPVPSFDQVAPDIRVPPRVEQVVRRLLAKDPAERFTSAREAAAAIRHTAEGSLASTLPGRQELPRTRYQPEVVISDLDEEATSSPHADTVAVQTTPPPAPAPVDGAAGPPQVASPSQPRVEAWASGQVVPPTSHDTERTPARSRATTVGLLLGGGVLLGGLAAVAIVLVLSSRSAPGAVPAGAGPAEIAEGAEGAEGEAGHGAGADDVEGEDPLAVESAGAGATAAGEATTDAAAEQGSPEEDHAGAGSAGEDRAERAARGPRRTAGQRRTAGGGSGRPTRTTMRAAGTERGGEPSGERGTGAGEGEGGEDTESGGGTWSGEVIQQPEF